MIDLEQERKDFEEQWKVLGGHLLYVEWTTDHMYSLSATANALSKSDRISLFNAINTAWGLWVVQANQKKSVIDSLKAQLGQLDKVWISVDFMLPNEGEKVLIMIGDEQTVAEKCNVFGFIDVIDREAYEQI